MRLVHFLTLLFSMHCIDCKCQVYQWGSSEKYKIEDSLFLEWEKTLPKAHDDSEVFRIIQIISDTIQKIKTKRHITEIRMYPPDKNKYYEDIAKRSMPSLIRDLKSQIAKDSSKKSLLRKVDDEQVAPEPEPDFL